MSARIISPETAMIRQLSEAEVEQICGAGPEGGCVDPNPEPKTLAEMLQDILNPPTFDDFTTIH